ncbi:hypothetical protein H5410_025141 [Solanum commersonii]|uniref:Uncharacterized protein n=1 Tax=Solanum commersonii TaxID=4109 RepID=A0A9J5YSY2_SOLCO|nr:hypothetical protein H5410_025141 [Solanum commersonii]
MRGELTTSIIQPLKILRGAFEYKEGVNCPPLIDKILSRTKSWTTKFLSYVGRAKLIKSVSVLGSDIYPSKESGKDN